MIVLNNSTYPICGNPPDGLGSRPTGVVPNVGSFSPTLGRIGTLICSIFFLLLLVSISAFAQDKPTSRTNTRSATPSRLRALQSSAATISTTAATTLQTQATTLLSRSLTTSTLSLEGKNLLQDSTQKTQSKSGIDTIITFAAQDSMRYFVRDKHLRLRGAAFVKNRAQTLSAEVIDVYFGKGYMQASTARDSLGRVYGVPKFTDGKESYYGATLSYNFRTQRGTISLAETKMGEGFFFGERVKRVNEDTFFMQDGCYTTCDKAHPHFYFKSPRMKVITKDKVFADPLIFYIEDIPILAVPFGLFMDIGGESGRRSGVLIPQVFVSSPIGSTSGRGFAFENLGYYFAINDNLDAKLTASFYTKGGVVGRLQGNYVFGRRFRGNVDVSYGYVRFAPTDDFSEQWSFSATHNQELTPFTSIQGSLNFSSPGFIRATQFDLNRRVTQTLNSNFSINHRFDNGIPLGVSYRRTQNLANNEISQNVSANTSIPQLFPLKNLVPRDSWLADVSFSYGVSATADFLKAADSVAGETEVQRLRRQIAQPFSARIQHSPSINISPKLGYFTVSPGIGYRENWYFRSIAQRRIDSTNRNKTVDSIVPGFFREYSTDFRIDVATTLYGIVNPRILGVNSLRHTLRPQIGFTYTPDLRAAQFGMTNRVLEESGDKPYQDSLKQERLYSPFELDQGSIPQPLTAAITWGLGNNFEAKIAESDTSEKVIQLMSVNVNGSVNLAAEKFQWSPISIGFSNTLGGVVQFSGGATFDIYSQKSDSIVRGNSITRFFTREDEFAWNKGQGLGRFTNVGFTLSYAVGSSGGIQAGAVVTGQGDSLQNSAPKQQQNSEEAALGARFQQRIDNTYDRVDLFGDQTPGVRPLDVSWNSSYNAAFNYAPESAPGLQPTISALIAAQFSLTLEKSWRMNTGFSYDVVTNAFNAPQFTLSKDLHCWEMSLTWNPIGQSQGFIFRIGMKAAQLRDIQYTRRESPLFRQ